MTLFVDKQKITGKETEQLFSAGISLLLSKAYPAAYSCFNRISDEDFSVPYNKALCCFMVKWHDECYRLLCESEQLMSGRNITREAELPEAFLRYDHAEVKSISACLGGKYKHIEKLINNITDNDNL